MSGNYREIQEVPNDDFFKDVFGQMIRVQE